MKRVLQIALGLAGAAAAVLLYRFPPDRFAIYPACPFHALTGWDCPGCGGTRALAALMHGEFLHAFLLNPLLPVFALAMFLLWRFRERVDRHGAATACGVVISLVLLTAARNLLHF